MHRLVASFITENLSYHGAKFVITSSMKTIYPDSKVHGANIGPIWVLLAPDGPHVGPMNVAIRVVTGRHYDSVFGVQSVARNLDLCHHCVEIFI